MDFLEKAARAAAQAAQEQVNELKMGALELAEDLAGAAPTSSLNSSGHKEVEFRDGPLGFRLEGTMVVSVEPNSQASKLGVEAGDRIAMVAGYAVPDFDPDDEEGEEKAAKVVKKWLKEMPRPSSLSFVPVAAEEEEEDVQNAQDEALADSADPLTSGDMLADLSADAAFDEGCREAAPTSDADKANLKALMQLASEWQQQDESAEAAHPADMQALQADLRHEQEERRQLAIELQRMRKDKSQATASMQSMKATHAKKVAELQAQLSSMKEEHKKALLSASAGEADNYSALEAAEAREKVMEEELSRLRKAVESSEQAAAKAEATRARESEDLRTRVAEQEERARVAEARTEALASELQGFCQAHDAELELLRGERADLERRQSEQKQAHEDRFKEAQEKAAEELAEVKRQVDEAWRVAAEHKAAVRAAEAEAAAAALEASTARNEASRSSLQARADQPFRDIDLGDDDDATKAPRGPAHGDAAASGDSMALYQRIDMLERRCVSLQKKLNSRPVVFQNPVGSGGDDTEMGRSWQRPKWELGLVSVCGPKVGAVAVAGYTAVHEILRAITRKLLKQDALLWLFYAHLLFLYVIAASSYAEITPVQDGITGDIQLKEGSSLPSAPLLESGAPER